MTKFRDPLMNHMPLGYALIRVIFDESNQAQNIVYEDVNHAYESITGIKSQNLIGISLKSNAFDYQTEIDNWITFLGEVCKTGKTHEVLRFIRHANKYYRVIAYSPQKDYCALVFVDIALSPNLSDISRNFFSMSTHQSDYQKITDTLLKETRAKFAILNLLNPSICEMTSIALSGNIQQIKKAERIIGFKIIGKKWPVKDDFYIKTPQKLVYVFSTMNTLTHHVVPKKSMSFILERFSLGNTVLLLIVHDGKCLANIILVYPKKAPPPDQAMLEDVSKKIAHALKKMNHSFDAAIPVANIINHQHTLDQGQIDKVVSHATASRPTLIRTMVNLLSVMTNTLSPPTDLHISEMINEVPALIATQADCDVAFIFQKRVANQGVSLTYHWIKDATSLNENNIKDFHFSEAFVASVQAMFREHSHYLMKKDFSPQDSEIKRLESLTKNTRNHISFQLYFDETFLGFITFINPNQALIDNAGELSLFSLFAKIITHALMSQKLNASTQVSAPTTLNQLRQKPGFLTEMNHELRAPLEGIASAIYLIKTMSLTDEQSHYLDVANLSLESLKEIVTNYMDLDHLETERIQLKPESIDLEQEIVKVVRIQSLLAQEKNLDLNFHYDYSIPSRMDIDSLRLKQIIMNLLNNAIKYTEKGGVSLSVDLLETHNDMYTIRFSFEDTGIGITKQDLDHVTAKYFQVDSVSVHQQIGSGLGLTITSELIKLLGGSLQFHSKLDQGSVFLFTLDIPKSSIQPALALTGNSRCLLITNKGDQDRLYSMLVQASLPVQTTSVDELEVARRLTEHHYHSIILRKGNHEEILRTLIRLKKNTTDTPYRIIISNPHQDRVHTDLYRDSRIDAILEKYATRSEVLEAMMPRGHDNLHPKDDVPTHRTIENSTVLLVEDNLLNNKAMSIMIERYGLHVDKALNGFDALEMAKTKNYDLVLMDIQMPKLSGVDATMKIRRINAHYAQVPIIAITAYNYDKDLDLLKAARMSDVLVKPIDKTDLYRIISQHLPQTPSMPLNETSDIVPSDIKVFSEIEFFERIDMSVSLANELIDIFFKEYPMDLKKIKSALLRKDNSDLYASLHNFKGSCVFLSAHRLVWIINQIIDNVYHEPQEHFIKTHIEALETEITTFVNALKNYQLRILHQA
ncbi:MAG: response regulator [Candidatus Izemoplasmatales bacterium]|nr:response regulator [Candidatus Izemoplasmatales bacterium]